MSQVLLIAELRSAARYAGLSLADRAADRIEELEAQLAAAPAAVQPVAVFEGYLDGGNAIIKWHGEGLPAGTLLYAVQSTPLSI